MSFFWSLLIILLVLALLTKSGQHINPKWFVVILMMLPLWFVRSFIDGQTVADVPEYMDIYSSMSGTSYSDIITGNLHLEYIEYEKGWLLFNKVLQSFFPPQQYLLIIGSVIVFLAYAFVIKKYSYLPWLSCVILLCTIYPQSLFVLRQHTAMAICMLSIPFLIERKIYYFFAIVTVAVLFHNTAIVFYPLYFISLLAKNKMFYLYYAVITLLLFLFASLLLDKILDYSLFTKDYMYYVERKTSYGNLTGSIIVLFKICFVYYFLRPNLNIDGVSKILWIMLLISFSISLLNSTVPFISRLNEYFSYCEILLIPLCMKNVQHASKPFLVCGIVIFYIALTLYYSRWTQPYMANMKLINF